MCAQYTKPMNKLSEDGFWELVDGDWIATDKQKEALKSGVAPHSKPDDNAEPVQFKPQTVSATQDEVIVNETAMSDQVGLSELTTTNTHTTGVEKYLGNPFYQDKSSRIQFDGIVDPGAEKIKHELLTAHEDIQSKAREKFMSGDMSHAAEELVEQMYSDEEVVLTELPLKVRAVEILSPDTISEDGFSIISTSEHLGVRGIITNERLLLIDSTEDAITKLTNPKDEYKVESFQRDHAGIFEVSHKIMHDFWVKSVDLLDITGTEFHFSDNSKSSKIVKRYHSEASVIFIMFGMLLFGLSWLDQSFEAGFWITNSIALLMFFIALCVYHYLSKIKHFTTSSTFGKERNLKIGYFDRIHNRNLVLDLDLEDGQELIATIQWLKILQKNMRENQN